ncbi:30S ribosomal protein S21 [uncultured Tenacibaculum sp.]|uniref:30S ribosomal protein S21 n=1 Tax=uncultured Tenacibaculum sp. TaxID=174713 RepID=UPI002625A51F|nr:30S ribosomal protein S21 [uncultured Tenacibaculum sp.]
MLIIKVKDGENIDRALKRYRKKYRDVKLLREIRGRKEYVKESVRRREEVKKAEYKQKVLLKDD